MIPTEIITLLGGSIFGAVAKYAGLSMDLKRQQQALLMQRFDTSEKSVEAAREGPRHGNKEYQWTKRIIALTVVFSTVLLPKLVALLNLAFHWSIPVIYGYDQMTHVFLWFGEYNQVHWQILTGVPVAPIEWHILSAITGAYFGSSIVHNSK